MARVRTFHTHLDRRIAPLGVDLPYWAVVIAAFFLCCFFVPLGVWGPCPAVALFFVFRALCGTQQKRHLTQVMHWLVGWSVDPELLPLGAEGAALWTVNRATPAC